MIFDIKRYAIHDGPGIRTTVFFKGCPLNCSWCHNPEGIASGQQTMWWSERCLGCRDCEGACSEGAISFPEGKLSLDASRCNTCGQCAEVCYSHAIEVVGKEMTPGQVIEEIEKDTVFYDESGGGVTFSGGEPLMQPDFLHDILKLCKERDIHTVVDTSGYADSDTLLEISDDIDLFLYDLKMMDDEEHRKLTGVSNSLILENLRMLSERGRPTCVRFSLIPGINDDEQTIRDLGALVSSLETVPRLHVLPYHRAGTEKARRLDTQREPFVKSPPSPETLRSVKHQLERFDLEVRIGG